MRVLLIVAIVAQFIGIFVKCFGIGSLVHSIKHDKEDENHFGIYASYSMLFSILIEVALVLALIRLW